MENAVRFETNYPLGLITLVDPKGGNRLNPDSIAAFQSAMESALADSSVRLIILRALGGAGADFCLGMDFDSAGESLAAGAAEQRRATVRSYGNLLERISTGPKPVLALVGGAVKAGGMGIVGACDLVIATASASFELSEVLFGLIPANVLPYLIGRRISLQKAKALVLSSRRVGAEEACTIGLADITSSDEDADATVRAVLKTMLRAEPGALAETKAFTAAIDGLSSGEARTLAQDTLLRLMERSEFSEAIASFAAGSSPRWFTRFKSTESLFWPPSPGDGDGGHT